MRRTKSTQVPDNRNSLDNHSTNLPNSIERGRAIYGSSTIVESGNVGGGGLEVMRDCTTRPPCQRPVDPPDSAPVGAADVVVDVWALVDWVLAAVVAGRC